MGRCVARRCQSHTDDRLVVDVVVFFLFFQLLKHGNAFKERLERALLKGLVGFRAFGFEKFLHPDVQAHLFRGIIGEDAVEIKSNAKFGIAGVVFKRVAVNVSGGIAARNGLGDIAPVL